MPTSFADLVKHNVFTLVDEIPRYGSDSSSSSSSSYCYYYACMTRKQLICKRPMVGDAEVPFRRTYVLYINKFETKMTQW